ncbi:MAG: hypothetical protein KDJ52_24915 [Anaerolineae bacterium]|nr:hypothetical protein [Anaerolineae bacterium]
MSQQNNKSYLLIGHVTKDVLPNGEFMHGGTVTYGSVVAKKMGWKPIVVTAASPNFSPLPFLADIDWHILPSADTTTFCNTYDTEGNRQQIIGPIARSIRPDDIPFAYLSAPIVHLCPLNEEVPTSMPSRFEESLVITTPQGWMRQWDAQGRVSRKEWDDADKLLPNVNAAVISIEDIEGNWSIAEQWAVLAPVLIVTQGAEGCTIFSDGQRQQVPPRPAQPTDPTGAGDVFATAFAIRLEESHDLWEAARFANVTASMAIERQGPEGAPDRTEVEDYLAEHPVKKTIC